MMRPGELSRLTAQYMAYHPHSGTIKHAATLDELHRWAKSSKLRFRQGDPQNLDDPQFAPEEFSVFHTDYTPLNNEEVTTLASADVPAPAR